MVANIKILRIGKDKDENAIIIKNLLRENQAPYLFRVGDQIKIFSDESISTVRRNAMIQVQIRPSIAWLESRLKELHWKIKTSLENDHYTSQADVYERNYLLEILNEVKSTLGE